MQTFDVRTIDGVEGLSSLEDKSIKLLYGSPPYPNAKRNYGVWKEGDYLEIMSTFIDAAIPKLRDDGFIVVNVKANRTAQKKGANSCRSLTVERLAILLEEKYGLYCVDIEIWVKTNPVPTGLRCACQDAYEQNLWFAKSPYWKLNIDPIRTPYTAATLQTYERTTYHPRKNGLGYISKDKKIVPNANGALPKNIISGAVANNRTGHQAVQPEYLSEKYIKACTDEGDLVVDPWLGTGTTGAVAVRLGRLFIGFDVVDEYVTIARERIEKELQKT